MLVRRLLLPGHLLELPVRALPHLRVALRLGHRANLEDGLEEEVAVHALGDDLRHLGVLELDKGVVLGLAGLLVAGETQAGDLAELAEVSAHLFLVETVRDVADVENLRAFVLLAAKRPGDLLAELGSFLLGSLLGDGDGDAVTLGVGLELDDVIADILGRLLGLLGRRVGAILGGALGHRSLLLTTRRVGGGRFYETESASSRGGRRERLRAFSGSLAVAFAPVSVSSESGRVHGRESRVPWRSEPAPMRSQHFKAAATGAGQVI